jgi:predicted NAD/FAD-binding protein
MPPVPVAHQNSLPARPLDIAVVGTGIAGMAAAWLLSDRHRVTVYEQEGRPGGHSNTVDAPSPFGPVPVDTGFIVYNERTYPNLTALFRLLEVPTEPSEMSFAVSLDDGALEYAGSSLLTLFAQPRNLVRPRFWRMLRDIGRFYREAPSLAAGSDAPATLGELLDRHGFSSAFAEDHLLPMAAAIWSAPPATLRDHPAAAFVRFCGNHGLLSLADRPQWRTVTGGSRAYVRRLTARYADRIRLDRAVRRVRRMPGRVFIEDACGEIAAFDHVVIAAHADGALAMLADPSADERALLGAIRYQRNDAVLHSDPGLMPRRRRAWSSWNYQGRRGDTATGPAVTYWMNRLQNLPDAVPLFVTLNPPRLPRPGSILGSFVYEHPIFDPAAERAQAELWRLEGVRNTWFCGAYFGAGFHEDGLQAGLAVAEALGGVRRPWEVADANGRIHFAAPSVLPVEEVRS